MAKGVGGGGGSAFRMVGGRWVAMVLAVVGTVVVAYALSPGLRGDLGGLGGVVTSLGEVYAMGIRDFVLSFGVFAPIAYFFTMVLQVFVAPIPSAPVSLAGSLVFGVWEGFGLSLAGSIAGSILAFLAVRRWGEPLVARLVGREVLGRYAGGLGGLWLFAILLVPFMPDDAAVALAGLSKLSFRWFLLLMVAGRVPGHATTALLASDWVTGSAVVWIPAGLVIVAVLALTVAYRERLESFLLRRADDTDVGPAMASAKSELR